MSDTAKTDRKHSGLIPFKPGESGNPAGRPKGSRNKLGEEFIQALHADFQEHGKAVIARVREEKPADYMKVVAALLPKELHIKDTTVEDMSDDELLSTLTAVRGIIASSPGEEAADRATAA